MSLQASSRFGKTIRIAIANSVFAIVEPTVICSAFVPKLGSRFANTTLPPIEEDVFAKIVRSLR